MNRGGNSHANRKMFAHLYLSIDGGNRPHAQRAGVRHPGCYGLNRKGLDCPPTKPGKDFAGAFDSYPFNKFVSLSLGRVMPRVLLLLARKR